MENTPPAILQLDRSRHEYTATWQVNAKDHHDQGHYDWMTSQVFDYPRILEIGCGVGHSTLALLKNGHTVVCIEENPYCISATQTLLTEHGYSVAVIERGTPYFIDDHTYHIQYEGVGSTPNADCLLIEGDALGDPQLEAWLKQQPRFDAMACWLLGTHSSRGHNILIDTRLIPSAFEHRIFVQNNLYELADEILRNGGILNVIDRLQTPNTDTLREAVLDGHRDQARVTSLNVQQLEHTPFVNSEREGAMRLMLTTPVPEAATNGPVALSLVSVTSRKPCT
ncbi:class I SAM-dependent methyltransferase [Pseudomonas fluorescens]|uniref:class I SAM-dependent methyltransferase n=1 Tax=Pseudomonas fluorescens TaxID=294 RepID=UPI001BEB68D6|nr:hypothetical protein [Pseudomonas fluorescens]MBT2375347.1 hypothetical protein [Pseudomonas fluorescens]